MIKDEPRYLSLHRNGELTERAEHARQRLTCCDLCANSCRVNRLETTAGARCRTGWDCVVSSAGPHHGEERPISGHRGSGTIFFGWCNLRCVFCQNWELSQAGEGRLTSPAELAKIMLNLQGAGCHNINLVSPSHVIAQILSALTIAADEGLRLPLVYNSGGYDSLTGLALLDGVVDIYMPDMKFAASDVAHPYLGVNDYAEVNRQAVQEMHRQVGDLQCDTAGLARSGLLVRHLVLPNDLAGTTVTLTFLSEEVSRNTYLNLMDQYRPCYHANRHPELNRRPTTRELRAARKTAAALGLSRLDRC